VILQLQVQLLFTKLHQVVTARSVKGKELYVRMLEFRNKKNIVDSLEKKSTKKNHNNAAELFLLNLRRVLVKNKNRLFFVCLKFTPSFLLCLEFLPSFPS